MRVHIIMIALWLLWLPSTVNSPTLQTYPWPLLRPAHWREREGEEEGGGEGGGGWRRGKRGWWKERRGRRGVRRGRATLGYAKLERNSGTPSVFYIACAQSATMYTYMYLYLEHVNY